MSASTFVFIVIISGAVGLFIGYVMVANGWSVPGLGLMSREPKGEYIPDPKMTTLRVWNLNGVPWHAAPIPPTAHRCWTQTKGILTSDSFVRRCACGATSMNDLDERKIYWMNRNSRKR